MTTEFPNISAYIKRRERKARIQMQLRISRLLEYSFINGRVLHFWLRVGGLGYERTCYIWNRFGRQYFNIKGSFFILSRSVSCICNLRLLRAISFSLQLQLQHFALCLVRGTSHSKVFLKTWQT